MPDVSVEIEGQPKPQPACAVAVGDKMIIKTQMTSGLPIPLSAVSWSSSSSTTHSTAPSPDKGGECPLQNQAMTAGHAGIAV